MLSLPVFIVADEISSGRENVPVLNCEKAVDVPYCALSQSECCKETMTLLWDMQIKSAYGLILNDKLSLSHICDYPPPSNLEKGQCFQLFFLTH